MKNISKQEAFERMFKGEEVYCEASRYRIRSNILEVKTGRGEWAESYASFNTFDSRNWSLPDPPEDPFKEMDKAIESYFDSGDWAQSNSRQNYKAIGRFIVQAAVKLIEQKYKLEGK